MTRPADITTRPDAGHPLAIAREHAARQGGTGVRAPVSPTVRSAFDGTFWRVWDVIPQPVSVPIMLEALDTAQAQSLTISASMPRFEPANLEAADPIPGPPRRIARLQICAVEIGASAADTIECDVGVGVALTVPTRYVRASIQDYTAGLMPQPGAQPPPQPPIPAYSATINVSAGVRTPAARRTQIAYVTLDQLPEGDPPPGASPEWIAAGIATAGIRGVMAAFLAGAFPP